MTSIEIANRAMDLLGTENLVSLSDNTKEARIFNRNYDLCRKSVLSMHPWNFATKRVILSTLDATPPAFDFVNRFALPLDYIRATIMTFDIDDWRFEDNFIVTDNTTVSMGYVYDVTDVNKFSPMFTDCLAGYIAIWCCNSITQSNDLKKDLQENFWKNALRLAKFLDSIEDPKKEIDPDVWMRSRVGPSQGFVRDPQT
jgi:hypothetical protein